MNQAEEREHYQDTTDKAEEKRASGHESPWICGKLCEVRFGAQKRPFLGSLYVE